jgi:hypothetical protein
MSQRIADIASLFAAGNRVTVDGRTRSGPLMPNREEKYHYLLTKDNPVFSKTLARDSTFVKLAIDPLFVFIYEGDVFQNIDTAYLLATGKQAAPGMQPLQKMKDIMQTATGIVSTLKSDEFNIPNFMIVTGIVYDYYSRVRRLIYDIPFSNKKDAFNSDGTMRAFVNSNMTSRYMKSISVFGNDEEFYGNAAGFTSYEMAETFTRLMKKQYKTPEDDAVMEQLKQDSEKAESNAPAGLSSVAGDSPTVYHDKIYREKYHVTDDSVTVSGHVVRYDVLMRYVLSSFTKYVLGPVGASVSDPFGKEKTVYAGDDTGHRMYELMHNVRTNVKGYLTGASQEQRTKIMETYRAFEEKYRESWDYSIDQLEQMGEGEKASKSMSFTTQEIVDYNTRNVSREGINVVDWGTGPFNYPTTKYPTVKLEVMLYELLRGYHLDVIPSTLDLILRIKNQVIINETFNETKGTKVLHTIDTDEIIADLIQTIDIYSGNVQQRSALPSQPIATAPTPSSFAPPSAPIATAPIATAPTPSSFVPPSAPIATAPIATAPIATAPIATAPIATAGAELSFLNANPSTSSSFVPPSVFAPPIAPPGSFFGVNTASPPPFSQNQADELVKGKRGDGERRYSEIPSDEEEETGEQETGEQETGEGTFRGKVSPPKEGVNAYDTFFAGTQPVRGSSFNDTINYSDIPSDEEEETGEQESGEGTFGGNFSPPKEGVNAYDAFFGAR